MVLSFFFHGHTLVACTFIKILLVCPHGVLSKGVWAGVVQSSWSIGRVQFCRVLAVRLARHVWRGSEAVDGWQVYMVILFYFIPGRMATASCGASCEVPDWFAGRSFCWHGHEVYDGFPTVGSAVTWERITKTLRRSTAAGYCPRPR